MDVLYLSEQGCKDPWLFYEAKTGPASRKFWGKLPVVSFDGLSFSGRVLTIICS
jgi:hypothetical protein